MPRIPIEIDGTPVQGRRHHIQVAADDKGHPHGGQPSDHAPPRRSRAGGPQPHGQAHNHRCQFRRKMPLPSDPWRGPDVVKGQREIEQDNRDDDGRPSLGETEWGHQIAS